MDLSQTSAWCRRLMEQVVVVAAYWLAGKLALLLAIPPGYATAVWPAAGLALAGMLLLGYRIWPGVLLGSFLINFWTSFDPSSAAAIVKSVTLALGIGAGAALQAAGGAWLVRRWVGFPNEFTDERAVIKLLVGCVPVSCFVSPTVGVTALFLAGVVPGSSCLFNWWTWWVGDTIGAMIFAPLALLWAVRPHNGVRRRQFSISVPLGLMFALVVVLFIHVSSWEHHRLQTDFERRADEWTQSLRKDLDRHLEAMGSLERFYASATQVSRLEFRALVQGLFPRFEGVQAVEWVPRVADAQRLASEETAAREGLAAFQITELDARGGFVRAAPRAEYFPVYDVQPTAGNERALGFDLASDPVRREAMDRARDTGQPITTGRVRLVQETSNQFGVLVFQPIYQPGQPRATVAERRQHLRGYICGVFRVGDMLMATLNGAERRGMEMRLHDEAAPAPERLLAGATLEAKPRSNIPPLRKANAFPIAGRQWAFEFSLSADYLAANRSWAAWTVLAAGLLFAGLLEAFLLVVTGRTARIEDIVEQRTEELQAANGELQLQIAERRSAETALAEKHRLLITVISALPDRIYVKDRESRFLLHNAAEARGMGLADDASLVGRSDADFYPEELADLYRKDEESVLATGHMLLDREEPGFDLVTKRNRWLLTTKVPLRNAHGEIVGLVGLGRDITERKEADLLLKRQRLAMDMAMDGIAVLNDAGEYLYLNRAHVTLFGYDSPDELLGMTWRVFYGGDEAARIEREIFPRLQANGRWHGEVTARRKDGTLFAEGVSLTQVEGVGLICVCRDITAQKQAETQVRELNAQLERRVTERTAQLAAVNEELTQREERLRTYQQQLRAVSAQLLQTEEAERRRIAADIHDQVGQTLAACRIKLGELASALSGAPEKKQTETVRALLEQAIQETRSLTFDLSPPVLHELGLAPALEWLAEQHASRDGLRVECEASGTTSPNGELSVLLFRIARELLVNVVKHARAREARVRLRCDSAAVRIEVIDDGVGFESADAQAPQGRSDGFGLFSIRDRLRFIDGRLEVDSKPGRGTRVVVTVPLAHATTATLETKRP